MSPNPKNQKTLLVAYIIITDLISLDNVRFAAPRNVFSTLSSHIPQFTGKLIIREEHSTFVIYLQSWPKYMRQTLALV